VEAGELNEIPAHPYPGKHWEYDPFSGEVN